VTVELQLISLVIVLLKIIKHLYSPNQYYMKRFASLALVISLLALASCASSKPCPAYSKVSAPQKALG